ncbi:cyclase family protein [Marispirochaeta sp.]|jgi:arylformamidase|uniref:cyclase family protein n=1 Tax=Marispirochaeta sp. TaxID=2038653 RepID=UPI0029C77E94|nr:cyclase family protein [Marispirochaeta sp.]
MYYDLSCGFDEDCFHPFGFPHFRNVQHFASHGCRHACATFSLHTATHIDAPWHMVKDGKRLDEIPLQELIGDALVVDLSENYGPETPPARGISREHLEDRLKKKNLSLKAGDALIVYTGRASLFVHDPSRYYDEYCTLDAGAAAWAAEKGVRLIGIDAPDIDLRSEYTEQPFRAGNHRFLLGKGIYIIENVGGEITEVLDRRIELIPAPLKVQGEFASGAPVRLIGRL